MATIEHPGVRKAGLAASKPEAEPNFDVREARRIVAQDFDRKPWIYWTDSLITVTVGYAAVGYYLSAPVSPAKFAALAVGAFALFRLGSFIHEIAHMGRGVMTGFKVFWNLCCGIPMLMPSYLYDCHIDHHAVPHYGTHHDGEYLPLGRGPISRLVWYMCQILLIPLLSVVRFLILTPISFLHPKLREWVLVHCSSYVMNPWYHRELPRHQHRTVWALLDIACFLRCLPMVGLVLLGYKSWTHWVELYSLAVCVIGLNWTRNLVAHHYRNEGEEMSHVEQLVDSINIEGLPVATELFFPLGLRYHALHHLFPGLPYHSLGSAHRRLMENLPADSAYRSTVRSGFFVALKELIRDASGKSQPQPEAARAA